MAEENKQEEVKQEEVKKEVQPSQVPQEETKAEEKPEEKLKEDKSSSLPSSPKGDLEKEEAKPEKKVEEKKEPKVESKPEPKSVKVPAKFKKLVEEIGNMSVLDLAELVKILEDKFGVSATAPVVAAPVGGPAGAPVQAKSKFNIELTAIGEKKIEVIKAVRDITQKGLKDSKDLVDAVASGAQMVKENVKKEEAEEIKKKFEVAGATVELK